MKAKSIKGNSAEEIKAALQQSMAADFKPTLAIIFLSFKVDRKSVCKILYDEGIPVFGATTNGQFIDEETKSAAIVVLLLDINPKYFYISFDEFPEKNCREKTRAVAKHSLEKFAHPAFLIASSNTETDAEELLLGIEDIIGCLLYTSPSPRDRTRYRMPSSA